MKKRNRFTYLLTLPSFVKWAAAISAASLFTLKLWLFKVPALFPGADDLGDLYYEMCLATAGAVIFYTGVNHIPAEQRKEKIAVYVNNVIIGKVLKTLSRLTYGITKRGDAQSLSLDELVEECKKVDPRRKCLIDEVQYENWYVAIDRYHAEMREHLRDLLIFSDTLSAEMLECITKLENEFTIFNIARGRYAHNPTLEMWGHGLHGCLKAAKQLYQQMLKEFGIYLR